MRVKVRLLRTEILRHLNSFDLLLIFSGAAQFEVTGPVEILMLAALGSTD